VERRLRQVGLVGAIAALVVGIAGCGSSANKTTGGTAAGTSAGGKATFSDPTQGVSKTQIDYGMIYDQTGPTAPTQVPFGDGMLSAFKAANDKGGILGRKINPIKCDEKYDVAPALACLKNMITQQPVVALSGLNNSSFQAAGLPLVQQAKIPVIGPESTSMGIVKPFPGYVWATECTYPNQADVAVAYAAKKLGKKTFTAVGLGGNVASADAYLGQIKERVQKMGASYKETVHYEYTAPNLDQQAQKIASDKPDVIFTHGGTGQNVLAFKSLEKYGVTNTLVIGIFAQETDPIALASPKVGANYYAVNCYSNAKQTDVPGVTDMVAAAKAAGYAPDIYNSSDFTNGYVNGLLVIHALTLAGDKLTRQSLNAVMPTIKNFDTKGLSPNITFGADNSVGVNAVRPYKFNYSTNVWEPDGDYAMYEKCNSHEFLNGNINAWSPDCIS
jgi:branched-chain amino acid transport system substrate-binding protein